MVTDGNNMVWLPDPATLKSDGFSSGIKSMEPHVLKIYLSPDTWDCSHEIFRLVPSYGSFEYNGQTLKRGKTGSGLWNSFTFAFETPTFPTSDISALGLKNFKKNIVQYVLDNDAGNRSVYKEVERTKSLHTYVEEFDKGVNME